MVIDIEKVDLPLIRRTRRILARVPLCVSGKINDETAFKEETFTIAVNADGGLIQLRKPVRKGQCLSLLQIETGQQEVCIVAYIHPINDGFTSVRVQFPEPHPEFWHIAFPPDDWTTRHPDSKFNRRSRSQNSDARVHEVGQL
jgi:hypothetical protein